MNTKIDHDSGRLKILIVDRGSRFGINLKKELKKHEGEIFISPELPGNSRMFNWCFIINPPVEVIRNVSGEAGRHLKNAILIFVNKKNNTVDFFKILKAHDRNIKVINLVNWPADGEDLEKVLWFAFSKSSENFLELHGPVREVERKHENTVWFKLPSVKPRYVPLIILFILFILHLLFVPFLIIASLNVYRGSLALSGRDFPSLLSYSRQAKQNLSTCRTLYSLARPTLSLFSLSSFTDDAIDLDSTVIDILQDSQALYQKSQTIVGQLFKKNKTDAEMKSLAGQVSALRKDIDSLSQKLSYAQNKMPAWEKLGPARREIGKALDALNMVSRLLPGFDSLFAKGGEKTYLLLFANNLELRPGGGFIGSFGLVRVANYTLEDIKIYDVYDADGQLTEHVEPPDAIRLYLEQPNWFLRDSAFSPDFLVNYDQAKLFLQREVNINTLDGAVLLTTSTIQNILGATGELYIPDYKEKVNKDNFYLKAQIYSENGFFPGSIQKKQFLGTVTDQLLYNLQTDLNPAVLQAIKKSLDEKQMVMQFEDKNLQRLIDTLYWSGRVIQPVCSDSTAAGKCMSDYLFSYDANLGVNKANYYIKRSQNLSVTLKKDGTVNNKYVLTLRNEATSDIFPGGTYRNYLQIMLPHGANIKSITKNNALMEKVDIGDAMYKTVGLFVEIPPKQKATVEIDYALADKIKAGTGQYQLIIQKQIGSANSDLQVKLAASSAYHIADKNFGSLAKDGEILYNTTLSADKIFLVDFTKE